MDEEDGRLGPLPGHNIGNASPRPMNVTGSRAQQDGPADVLTDASTMSLCLPPSHSNLKTLRVPRVSILRSGIDQRLTKALIHHEVMP